MLLYTIAGSYTELILHKTPSYKRNDLSTEVFIYRHGHKYMQRSELLFPSKCEKIHAKQRTYEPLLFFLKRQLQVELQLMIVLLIY